MKDKFKKIKLHPENPIEVLEKEPFKNDLLGFQDSVIRLSHIIDCIETPFTVGVFGSWGSGKTSFMKMLDAQLTKEKYVTFWFDAWQYENENSLLLPLLSKLVKDFNLKKETKGKITKIGTAVLWVATNALLKGITSGTVNIEDVSKNLKSIEKEYEKYVSQMDSLKEEFKTLVKEIKKDKPALIIFIDDLDRCMPENAVRLIENIKHFLSVEGCIFILGVDKEILSKGIQARYGSELISGREYLEKIINLSFFVPHKMEASKNFIIETFKKFAETEWYKEISKEIEEFNKFISTIGIDNPRKLRLLVFRYLLFLTLSDYRKYIRELVIKLIVYREFFPEAYSHKKERNDVKYFPRYLDRDAQGNVVQTPFSEIAQRSCEDFATITTSEQLKWLTAFSAGTGRMLRVFKMEDNEIENLKRSLDTSQKEELNKFITSGCRKQHQDYFNIVDFLFSFS